MGFKEEEEVWAPLRRSRPWKVVPGLLVPSWSEALGAALQLGEAPGDGLSTKEGAKGLAGLGLGIGSLFKGRLSELSLQSIFNRCEQPSGFSR